jgi:hypothetical protein
MRPHSFRDAAVCFVFKSQDSKRYDEAMNRTARSLHSFLILLLFLAFGPAIWTSAQSRADKSVNVPFPGFTIRLRFSDKALATLKARKETVKVAAYITGDPKAGTAKKYIDEMGTISFEQVSVEVPPGKDAAFPALELDANDLRRVANQQDLQMLINVFSGRRSSPDNLLDCGIYEGPLRVAQAKDAEITCQLIDERFP